MQAEDGAHVPCVIFLGMPAKRNDMRFIAENRMRLNRTDTGIDGISAISTDGDATAFSFYSLRNTEFRTPSHEYCRQDQTL
jgi:hypothetical protein